MRHGGIAINWEAIGAGAELLGAIGVIASLIYLATQIRRNDISTRASATQALLQTSTEMLLHNAYEGIQPDDFTEQQSASRLFAILSHFNNAHYQHSVGVLDAEVWEMYDSRLRRIIKEYLIFESWWKTGKINFTESFVKHVEGVIE